MPAVAATEVRRNDGGPAFAHVITTDVLTEDGYKTRTHVEDGMSLRDYFAAKAMQGLIAEQSAHYDRPQDDARRAYLYADAMLAERAK